MGMVLCTCAELALFQPAWLGVPGWCWDDAGIPGAIESRWAKERPLLNAHRQAEVALLRAQADKYDDGAALQGSIGWVGLGYAPK
ncbi:hypothetical protein GGS24DRAFT_470497 [Hypoxylon argillaceum]|nr:hypothetical protein GGS24DRAFT_470497 [Hypoxylon argillaceum]